MPSLQAAPTTRAHKSKPAATTPASPLERLYTRDEVAARYHVTPIWVTRHYRKFGLRPMRVGKRVLFRESDIEAADRRALGEM